MNKAFIFDMDGVLIDSEPTWQELERQYLPKLFGKEVAEKLGNLVGIGLKGLMDRAESLGAIFEREYVVEKYGEIAREVYRQSPITDGVDTLVAKLKSAHFGIGIVTQSPQNWIGQVIPRLPFRDKLDLVISLYEHPELRQKPEPDGFLEAIKQLGSSPDASIVLEDSNTGIQAGKTAKCFVIGYQGNLVDGYKQANADAYANTMDEVGKIVDEFAQP